MKFTDDDVKRLKKCIPPIGGLRIGLYAYITPEFDDDGSQNVDGHMKSFDVDALLARLEAAEAVCHVHGFDTSKSGEYLAWLRSKGE